jgi:hypothetical protein
MPSGKYFVPYNSEERAASNFKVMNVIQVHSASLGLNDLIEVELSLLVFFYKFPDEL